MYLYYISIFLLFFFFFSDSTTTEIYTLSLHDALPIYQWTGNPRLIIGNAAWSSGAGEARFACHTAFAGVHRCNCGMARSEEHTSELQSRRDLVCRLLLEKKKY